MMSLKNKIVLYFLPLVFLNCSKEELIFGKIEDSGSDYIIYLIQPEKLQEVAASYLGVVIDSAMVDSKGSFEFSSLPDASNPTLFELVIQKKGFPPNQLFNDTPLMSNYMPVVWQNDAVLNITANGNAFQNSFTIKNPSVENQSLLKLRDIKNEAYNNYLMGKEWQVEDGSQLLDKEKAILNYQKQLMDFAKNTSHLLPAMVALRWVSPENDYERVPEFLFNQCEKWKKEFSEHVWVEQLCEKSEKSLLPVLKGDVFPEGQLPLISKDTVLVYESLGGKLTIVDLWASWCAPCRKENREILTPLWEQYHEKGLQILAYGLESDEPAWKAAIEKDGAYRWLNASHLEGDDTPFLKMLRIQTIPANFILNSEGVVLAKNLHGKELMDFIENYIEELP